MRSFLIFCIIALMILSAGCAAQKGLQRVPSHVSPFGVQSVRIEVGERPSVTFCFGG